MFTTILLMAGGFVDSSEILDVNVVLWVTMCHCDIGLSLLFDVIVVLERFVNLLRFKSLSYSNYACGYPGYIWTSEICASAHGSCLCKYFSVCVHFFRFDAVFDRTKTMILVIFIFFAIYKTLLLILTFNIFDPFRDFPKYLQIYINWKENKK